ncbi:SCO3374 family protein [Streptomyces sp. NPDC012751]|uniref:SCO3374 family protein n=1 Tax=Streptomyces sp. NPDC012751 TaxID=3364846 RepID=UPI0036C646C5
MVGSVPTSAIPPSPTSLWPPSSTVPLPRRSPGRDAPAAAVPAAGPDAPARHWYENDLGWPTVPGRPLRLRLGVRFDVLDVPAEAGAGALRHLAAGSPVILRGDRMELLVAPGGADELPGLLDWLEWGAVALDMRALGAGDTLEAPPPPAGAYDPVAARPGSAGVPGAGTASAEGPGVVSAPGTAAGGSGAAVRTDAAGQGCEGPQRPLRAGSARAGAPPAAPVGAGSARALSAQGAAVWLRPPGPGHEAGTSLPAMPGMPGRTATPAVGREGSAPDLVRLVDTVAAHCHRVLLRRARAGHPVDRLDQPLAFS